MATEAAVERRSNPPIRLVDCRVDPPVYIPASITRGFPINSNSMDSIERLWGPARVELASAMSAAGEHLESQHWRWHNKALQYPPEWHCLVAIECEKQVQGLMALNTLLRPSILSPGGWVVYVDYVEKAPWNFRVPSNRNLPASKTPRFAGIGPLLIAEAIRMSIGKTASGRVGLHALPEAESFYSSRCGMRRIGPDPLYHNLVYFEYPEGVASQWLTDTGFSA